MKLNRFVKRGVAEAALFSYLLCQRKALCPFHCGLRSSLKLRARPHLAAAEET